ncbi:hypothetical protein [Paractinoplanes hotanensis]|uniref:Uncharacterized protein n=1 Tax=Paractinoplanes hotanensis TaxID=2906497 RepID=A0ABT0YFE4_9ACTN|nr:hypothetical protein [Actinoplanes hotanensis]MCM4084778.1 hypothetical protein [Actinoplanes hotanensis]
MTIHEDATTVEATSIGLRLHALASNCSSGSCPTVYSTDRATIVVQGYAVSGENAGVEVPDGERLVEIPVEVLLAAADQIRKQA